MRKHLKPLTPASTSGRRWSSLPETTPPQKATSMVHLPSAALTFSVRLSHDVVGGMELRGMSQTTVTPCEWVSVGEGGERGELTPLAAALVPVSKPSQSVLNLSELTQNRSRELWRTSLAR
jgi:hypothetical protein